MGEACVVCHGAEGNVYRVCRCNVVYHDECFRETVRRVPAHRARCPVCLAPHAREIDLEAACDVLVLFVCTMSWAGLSVYLLLTQRPLLWATPLHLAAGALHLLCTRRHWTRISNASSSVAVSPFHVTRWWLPTLESFFSLR